MTPALPLPLRLGGVELAGGAAVQVVVAVTQDPLETRVEQHDPTALVGWNTLRQRFEALSGLNNRILEAQVDGATVYRLQAVTGDAATARNVCNAIKAGGGDCQVKN